MKKLLTIIILSTTYLYSCNSVKPSSGNYYTNNKIDENQIIEAKLLNISHTGSEEILGKQINIKYGSYPKESNNIAFCTGNIDISTKKLSSKIYKFNEASKGYYCEIKNPEPNGPIGYSNNSKNDNLDKQEAIKLIKLLKTNNRSEKEIIDKAIEILTKEEVEIIDN